MIKQKNDIDWVKTFSIVGILLFNAGFWFGIVYLIYWFGRKL